MAAKIRTGSTYGDYQFITDKITRFTVARAAAQRWFNELKYGNSNGEGPVTARWIAMCDEHGMSPDAEFNDWTC